MYNCGRLPGKVSRMCDMRTNNRKIVNMLFFMKEHRHDLFSRLFTCGISRTAIMVLFCLHCNNLIQDSVFGRKPDWELFKRGPYTHLLCMPAHDHQSVWPKAGGGAYFAGVAEAIWANTLQGSVSGTNAVINKRNLA